MLESSLSGRDYSQLVKQARRLVPPTGDKLKLALLADVSTQHLVPLLRVLFAKAQIDVQIYEAGYDTVTLEALNTESGLYQFGAQIVVILQSVFKLRELYHEAQSDRGSFVAARAAQIKNVWQAIQKNLPVPVIQSTYVIPDGRAFGNFGLKVSESLESAVMELNREIVLSARGFPSVFLCDIDYLAAWQGRSSFLDEKLWALAKSLCALERLPDVAQAIVDIGLACRGRTVKCVILDLDNTVWGGVVGDDGLEGIGLGDLDEGGIFRSFQLYVRELARRGILLAVCSKNDEDLARRVFREHPGMVLREEDIAVFAVNWESKAANIARIRERLNIGLDAMVFLDDNAFERNLVRKMLPQVIVPELPEDPALYVRTLSELNLFETTSQSSLDAQRTNLYRDQEKREEAGKNYTDINAYLQSLETVATVSAFGPANLGRVAQLIQRSNQFNLTTRRYSESQCEAMARDRDQYETFTISIRDRFGDFGLVNVVILQKRDRTLEIDSFLMSCRVLQRGVEQLAMNKIFEYAHRGGYERVLGRYWPTSKNARVKDFFRQFGFVQSASTADGETEWLLGVDQYSPVSIYIQERTAVSNNGDISHDTF